MEQENKGRKFNLDNPEDMKQLKEEMKNSDYFTLEEGVSYKVKLLSKEINSIEKKFKDDIVTKYQIKVKVKGSDGSNFEGMWEVGISILNPILKDIDATFTVSRTGTGTNTRYNVTKDF